MRGKGVQWDDWVMIWSLGHGIEPLHNIGSYPPFRQLTLTTAVLDTADHDIHTPPPSPPPLDVRRASRLPHHFFFCLFSTTLQHPQTPLARSDRPNRLKRWPWGLGRKWGTRYGFLFTSGAKGTYLRWIGVGVIRTGVAGRRQCLLGDIGKEGSKRARIVFGMLRYLSEALN
jgi:hypothetical protein